MRVFFAAAFLLIGINASSACGNPLLWAMLFARVPEAKLVYEAELSARADRLVTARVFNGKPGQVYHLWSKSWLLELAEEMQPAVSRMITPGEELTVLLADEVAALRFTGGAGVAFIPPEALRGVERFDLITTTNALKSVWRDGLTYNEMIDLNLAFKGESQNSIPFSHLFTAK